MNRRRDLETCRAVTCGYRPELRARRLLVLRQIASLVPLVPADELRAVLYRVDALLSDNEHRQARRKRKR